MEFLEALPLVLGSYVSYGLVQRRVRLVLGRQRGADALAFRTFHHRALARELPWGEPGVSSGGWVVRPPTSQALGPLPAPWERSGWFRQHVGDATEARDLLLVGAPSQAASCLLRTDPGALQGLFTWAVVLRLWAGQLEAAEEAALALDRSVDDPALCSRLLGWVETRRAESSRGREAREAADRALAQLDRGEASLRGGPTWALLPAHLGVLRISLARLELDIWEARRRLKAAAAQGEGPLLHLVHAHLAVVLGDVPQAADRLAKALYHGRDRFFAGPILALRGIQQSRPALAAEARLLVDSGETEPLQSPAVQRGNE